MSDELGRIIAIIGEQGQVAGIGPDDDFYEAGFSSINALNLLLELETAYDVSLPDEQFIEARTPRALLAMVERVKQEQLA